MPRCQDNNDETHKFTERDIPDLTGYVAIVTGGKRNSGIGYETTKQLALKNARVYIASRSEDRVSQAIREMQASCGGKQLDLRFLKLDLQDLASVHATASSFAQHESRLDILINNAGIMNVPFELTPDGFERHWQVNYLSPFVFVSALLPMMLQTAATSGTKDRVRVVNVCSDLALYTGSKEIQFEDVNLTNAKGITKTMQRYGHSKQAAIRHAHELNARYSAHGITAYSLHPGVVRSNLQSGDPTLLGALMRVGVRLGADSTPLQGAYNSLYCATSPFAPTLCQGRYMAPVGRVNAKANDWLNDSFGNSQLWQWSETEMSRRGLTQR